MALPKGWRLAGQRRTVESGQAWVYEVARENDEAVYALKRLKNPKRRDRFVREVKVMADLADAGMAIIPPVISYDLDGQHPHFVMPWYEGGTVEDLVKGKRFVGDPSAGVALLIKVAEALEALHTARFAHRDMKPANILLDHDGVLLADLGLCLYAGDEAERLTGTSEAVGSRFYIAPENENGINEGEDQRPADLYAFAKIAWALLTGRQPLAREGQLEEGKRLADILADQRFTALDRLFERLLNRDPRARLTDWGEVLRELRAFEGILTGRPVQRTDDARHDLLEAARRIATLPVVREAAARQASVREQERWFNLVPQALQTAAGQARPEAEALTEATGGAIQFSVVGGGGFSLEELVRLERRLLPPGLDPNVPIGTWGGFALLCSTYSNLGHSIGFPSHQLRIGVHVSIQSDGVYLLRIPFFQHSQDGSVVIPEWLLDRYYRIQGPLPPQTAVALEAMTPFGVETATAFLDVAALYLKAISAGKSVLDPPDPRP